MAANSASSLPADPHWYQKAVIYQVNVRSFFDGNGDGIGDFKGLTDKLDYLQELGVTALWVMPFYPSPLRDDGYDISDYLSVNPMYGDIDDVREFIQEAHRRGLRVITELIINHTSDQHPWFQRARQAPKGSPERDFYVWSDTTEKYQEARIIFKDFEPSNWTWDPVAEQYYWHRFFHHQPDLNFDNPAVHDAVFETLEFWMDMGVDGFRLDAIPYLYEREGTTGENLPETHAFLKKLRAHIDANYQDKMLLAEANQWPEDTRPYFGDGDECHMNYNFPIMPRMYMSLQMEDSFPLFDILEQTPAVPAGCQWAMFLRNHDELTLEMVTEEERDYMWRTYSPNPRGRINLGIRRRIFPLVEGDAARVKLLNCLLLTMPGTPVLYYGDEIGMGDNIWMDDRFGVRTPMQWSDERNAGFSTADPQQLLLPVIADPQYCPAAVNVAVQDRNPNSHLNWTRNILRLRAAHPVFGRGSADFLRPQNSKVLAYLRADEVETVLVVANLAGTVQSVDLDLADFDGKAPYELASNSWLPTIGTDPYRITLPPHGFLLLQLARSADPALLVPDSWRDVFSAPAARAAFETALAASLSREQYAARPLQSAKLIDNLPLADDLQLVLVEVNASGMEPQTFVLPLRAVPVTADGLLNVQNHAGVAVSLVDAARDPAVARTLIDIAADNSIATTHGSLQGKTVEPFAFEGEVNLIEGGWTNANFRLGNGQVLKLFRRATPDPNPEWELGQYLSAQAPGVHTPQLLAVVKHVAVDERERVLAVVHEQVQHAGNAWDQFAGMLSEYLSDPSEPSLAKAEAQARLLGGRIAQMHNALLAAAEPSLAPVAFTSHYQRSIYATVRQALRRALIKLRSSSLTGDAADYASRLLAAEDELLCSLNPLKDERINAVRIRIHGALHLGNVLVSGADYLIIDLEGDTSRHLSERKLKLSPWRDVASMQQSIEHLAGFTLSQQVGADAGDALHWSEQVQAGLLYGYRNAAALALLPESEAAGAQLLRGFRLERDAEVLGFVLDRYPEWVAGALSSLLARS